MNGCRAGLIGLSGELIYGGKLNVFASKRSFRAVQNPLPTSGVEEASHSTAICLLPLVNIR
jgi:hypothetical protein